MCPIIMSLPSRTYVVRPGDCIESIAARFGCDWKRLWQHDENRKLQERRPSPNLLVAGDVVRLPMSLAPIPAQIQAGGAHRFRYCPTLTTIRLHLTREAGASSPLADTPYRLLFGARSVEGTTDGDGMLEARVPASLERAVLVIAPGTSKERRVVLRIGHLDPIEQGRGVQQRLRNLGLVSGLGTDEEVRRALAAFQKQHGLAISGAPTPETLAKLGEIHYG